MEQPTQTPVPEPLNNTQQGVQPDPYIPVKPSSGAPASKWMSAGIVLAVGVLLGIGIGYATFNNSSELETAYQSLLDKEFPDDESAQTAEYNRAVTDIKFQAGEASEPSQEFNDVQAKVRDVERKTDTNNMHAKLEEFYNDNGYYPTVYDEVTFAGIDAEALMDPDGLEVSQKSSLASSLPADPYTAAKPSSSQYTYYAYSCNDTSVIGECQAYVLYTWQEALDDYSTYQKRSLN